MDLCPMLVVSALAVTGAWAAPRTLIDTDFGQADHDAAEAGNARVSGQLPTGWTDNSGWAPTVVEYAQAEEEGRRYTRVDVLEAEEGRGQVAFMALPDITEETYFRLALTARSPDRATAELGIRLQGVPYSWVWSTRPDVSPGWREFTYDFVAGAQAQPVGFYIVLSGVTRLDLTSLSLRQLTREDYIAELRADYPGGGPPNLFRNSRFPLGLQSGWALGRDNSDGDDVAIAPDLDLTGPSGAPALRVETAEPSVLTTEPFGVPLAFEKHTASLFVRGAGPLKVSVLGDGRSLASTIVQLQPDEWQRAAVRFDPILMGTLYALRLEFGGALWVDGLQANTGEAPAEYTSRSACEVALGLPESDASMARIQFDDEPAEVLYAVSGQADGGTLRLQLIDAYGAATDLDPIRLADGFLQQGSVEFPLGRVAHGPFRLESWVEDGAGERISPYNELVFYRLPRPRYWGQDAPDSPFGVHTSSTTRHNLMAKAVGANWTRLHDAGFDYCGWWFLEREPDVWSFRDKELRRYRRDGIRIVAELGTAPEWASYYEKPHNGYFDRYYQPRDLADYENYCRTFVERYRDEIDAFDVWNEPWIHAWWGVGFDETKDDRAGYVTSEEPQKDFAAMMRVAHETVHGIVPGATVCGFNTTNSGGWENSMGGTEWTAGVLANGGMDHSDVIAYHHYTSGVNLYPGDEVERGLQSAVGPIREELGGVPRPIWMTEGSAARDTIGAGFYNHTLPYDTTEDIAETSDRLVRYVISLLANGVERIFLYSMHAQGHFSPSPSGGWRVIVTEEGYLHPSGAAHAIAAWLLEDTEFVERVELSETLNAYLFGGDGRAVAVLSPEPGHEGSPVPRPRGTQVLDVFGNPVPADAELGRHIMYVVSDASAASLGRSLAP